MEVVSLCPFRAVGLVWQPRPSAFSLLVVCKGTFELVPGAARLAEVQDYPNEEDNHWDDDSQKSLYSATDLAPAKPRADVLLVGHAFAPYGQEADAFVTRLIVGDIAKAIECVAERVWTAEPKVRRGSRITKASLRYERAAGGDGTSNPVGVPMYGPPDAFGMTPLPALQPPGFAVSRRGEPFPTIGYGPIAPQWPTRTQKLGRHAATFHSGRWHLAPLPFDLDPSYFNAAPDDQQVAEIRPDERIELVNMHPDIPHLMTSLPGLHPRAFVERAGKPPEEVLMRADTLWIDTDRQVATLTWRGQVALAAREEPGRVLIAMEEPGRTLSFLDIDRLLGRPSGPVSSGEESMDSSIEWIEPDESALADRPSTAGSAASPAPAVSALGENASAARRGDDREAASPLSRPPAPPPAPPSPAEAPPPAMLLLGVMETPVPLTEPPPADAQATPIAGAPRPGSVAMGPQAAPNPGALRAPAVAMGPQAAPGPGAPRASDPPPGGDPDKEFPTDERPVRAGPPREGVHILWLDADADAVGARLGAGAARTALLSPSRAPSVSRTLTVALEAAIGPDGRFEPPAVTLTGDLSLTLAPLDRLRALLTVAGALEPADERAAALRSKGERLLAGPSPDAASWLAGRIADDLEAALSARAGAPDSLAGARRSLHASRAYTRALVLGGRHVRGLLRDAGGATLAVYLSEAACVHLPLDERFRARILGELHPRVDATDPAPFALRVAAVARILTMPR